MRVYKYTAYTDDKKIVRGTVSNTSEAAAAQAVLKLGYHRILTLQSADKKTFLPKMSLGLKLQTIKDKEIVSFSLDLSNMLSSGITLISALQLIQQQTANKRMKEVVFDIINMIRNGNSFSGAIQKHNNIFPETYFEVIKASEQSGNLEQGLGYLANYLSKQIDTRKRLRQIFNYPVIVLTLAFIIGGFLVTNVLPTLVDMFGQLNTELPLITKVTMGFSRFLVDYKFIILLVVLIVVASIYLYLRTRSGKIALTRFMLKIPIVRDSILRTSLLTYTHMASMLLRAGLSLPVVMYHCAQTVSNLYIREILFQVRNQLIQGRSLSSALRSTNLFDSVSLEKIAIGERTGDINLAFTNISLAYEKAIDDSIKAFMAIIEPAIIIGIALVVGGLALSIITPMYSLVGSFK
ncbi:MAG: type II secretion system F family protein [Dehalococcoidales bacterium]